MNIHETLPRRENETVAQKYEHIFPGHEYKNLKRFSLEDVSAIFGDLMLNSSQRYGECGEAIEQQKGYAHRIEFSNPNKLAAWYLLLDTSLTQDKPSRAWISDLMKPGEQVGGMLEKHIGWISQDFRQGNAVGSVLGQSLSGKEPNIWSDGTVSLIGIVDAANKPVGLVLFKKGERPRQGEKVKTPILNSVLQPSAVPTAI